MISDTHGYLGSEITNKLKDFDELWHAGDWGEYSTFQDLENRIKIRGVYGNIDGQDIRSIYPKELNFAIEGVQIFMIHIGGYPGRCRKSIKNRLMTVKPDLFICGHSHICKVMKDHSLNLTHFNPGAIGKYGFHTRRTMMSFTIEDTKINTVKIYEYERS